jgi:ubiquinone/menaquinone biosynthesis C-methylase UbiE
MQGLKESIVIRHYVECYTSDVMEIFLEEYGFTGEQDVYNCFNTNSYKTINISEYETDYVWDYTKDPLITPVIIEEWRYLNSKLSKILEKGNKILSIGGGGSSQTHTMISPNSDYLAILNPSIWDLKHAGDPKGTKLIKVRALAEKLPFKSAVFDTIEIPATIDHINNQKEALKECYRVLSNGGILAITCGNNKSYYRNLIKRLRISIKDIHNHAHTWHASPSSLRELLASEGFSNIQLHTTAFLKLPKLIERRMNGRWVMRVHQTFSNRILPRVIGKEKGGMILVTAKAIKPS